MPWVHEKFRIEDIEALFEWLRSGARGKSSEYMVEKLTGLPADECQCSRKGIYIPHDAGDFRRCELLLRAVPELRPRLGEMSQYGPWCLLVPAWDELVGLLDSGSHTTLHKRISALREEYASRRPRR